MARARFHVLAATDGSRSADMAVAGARAFPWPAGSRATVLVVRNTALEPGHSLARGPLVHDPALGVGENARQELATRWKDAAVAVGEGDAAAVILGEAAKRKDGAIVLGWRGHGRFSRLLLGSTSRAVLRASAVPVLIVRQAPRKIRRAVLGLDGSRAAAKAVRFLARCAPPAGGAITVTSVVRPIPTPRHPLLPPNVVAQVKTDVDGENRKARAAAAKDLDKAAAILRRSGWRVRVQLRSGAPLAELLRAAKSARADLLVIGARGNSALDAGHLGSVTEGALNRCHIPVLVVR